MATDSNNDNLCYKKSFRIVITSCNFVDNAVYHCENNFAILTMVLRVPDCDGND